MNDSAPATAPPAYAASRQAAAAQPPAARAAASSPAPSVLGSGPRWGALGAAAGGKSRVNLALGGVSEMDADDGGGGGAEGGEDSREAYVEGTCEEMCPEAERNMRSAAAELNVFERVYHDDPKVRSGLSATYQSNA